MRQLQRGDVGEVAKDRPKEPLSEGLQKRNLPRRFYTKMSDEDLVASTQQLMKEEGITARTKLGRANGILYKELLARKKACPDIMERIGFERKICEMTDWASVGDDELVDYARELRREKKIITKTEFREKEGRLYPVLWNRGLLDRVFAESEPIVDSDAWDSALPAPEAIRKECKPCGFFANMRDVAFADYIQTFMKENGIRTKDGLKDAAEGMYKALLKREKRRPGIVARIGFVETRRDWDSLDDDKFVEQVQKLMKDKGISGKKELETVDRGLYDAVLRRERLSPETMDRIGFTEKRRERRDWKAMSDDEVEAYAYQEKNRKGLDGRKKLKIADTGLHQELAKRGLLDCMYPRTEPPGT